MFFKKKMVLPHLSPLTQSVDPHQAYSDLLMLDNHVCPVLLDLSAHKADKSLVIFIGGAMDDIYRPLYNGVFVPYRLRYANHQDTVYTTHASIDLAITAIKYWQEAGQKICLVGHSWGGKSVLKIARRLEQKTSVKIDLLITLDPVSRRILGSSEQTKPAIVKEWVNVFIDYKKASMEYSNVVARLGGPWGNCTHADRNIMLSHDELGIEITHAMAARMFDEVEQRVTTIS